MRKSAILALLFSLSTPLWAQEQHNFAFGGVNNYTDSMLISDTDAQDAANVITDEGDLRTTPGAVERYSVGYTTISYLGNFISQTESNVIIAQSGYTILASSSSGNLEPLVTMDAFRELDGVQAFKRFYLVDGVAPFYYDGVSTYTAAGMEPCRYVEFYANRLACVNTSTDTSKVYLSAYNAPENWTITTTADSAVIKYFNRDAGGAIKCVKSTPYGLFIGKETSAGLLKGDDADTFWWYYLSNDIGCVDDRSVQMVDGAITWLSRDGAYAWGGKGYPQLISGDIRGTTKNIRASASSEQSWTISTQAGWEQGSTSGWETAVAPGTMKSATYNMAAVELSPIGVAGEGGEGGVSAWTSPYTGSVLSFYSPTTAKYGSYVLRSNGTAVTWTGIQAENASTGVMLSSAAVNGNGYTSGAGLISLGRFPGQSIKIRIWSYYGSPTSGAQALSPAYDGAKGAAVYFVNAYDFDHAEYVANSTIISSSYDTGLTAPEYQEPDVNESTGITLGFYTSSDNSTWAGPLAFPLAAANKGRYWKYSLGFGADAPNVSSVTVAAFSTGTYSSVVYDFGPEISGFKTFSLSCTESEVNLSSAEFRTSNTSFGESDASPEWVSQPKNAPVAAAVGRFGQFRVIPNVGSSTQTISCTSALVPYVNGTQAPRVASLSNDGRYLLCVSTASTTQNDLCLLWQRNKKWVPIVGPSYGSLMVHNNEPMAGDGTSGSKIWDILQDGIYKYGDQPINSWWISKDFTLGAINNQKTIDRLWISAAGNGPSEFNIGWQPDRSGVWYSTSTALNTTAFVNKEVEGLFETLNIGRQLRFRFSASDPDREFRLKDYSVYYTVNPLIK